MGEAMGPDTVGALHAGADFMMEQMAPTSDQASADAADDEVARSHSTRSLDTTAEPQRLIPIQRPFPYAYLLQFLRLREQRKAEMQAVRPTNQAQPKECVPRGTRRTTMSHPTTRSRRRGSAAPRY